MAKAVKKKIESKSAAARKQQLTVSDLVVLSLLAERPMHGYNVNATLEQRKIRDWAPVSRPQVYYSLDKLNELGLIRVAKDAAPAAGPERRVFETTSAGLDRLAEALDASHWTDDNVYQPFLIWMALSWQARGRTFERQLENRRKYLLARIAGERSTLDDVLGEVGHSHHEAVWMIELFIAQAELEISWIDRIRRNASKREPARRVPSQK